MRSLTVAPEEREAHLEDELFVQLYRNATPNCREAVARLLGRQERQSESPYLHSEIA